MHSELIFAQNLVFSCSIRNGKNRINYAPYGNCCDPYFLHLDQLSIVLNAKDRSDLCMQTSCVSKWTASCEHITERARAPSKGPSLPSSYFLENAKKV